MGFMISIYSSGQGLIVEQPLAGVIHGPASSLLDSCYCAEISLLLRGVWLKPPVPQSGHGTERAELAFPDSNDGFEV